VTQIVIDNKRGKLMQQGANAGQQAQIEAEVSELLETLAV